MPRLRAYVAVLLLATSSCSSQPASLERDGNFELPTILLSVDNPEARVNFTLQIPAEADDAVTRVSWHAYDSQLEALNVRISHIGTPSVLLGKDGFECSGSDCRGEYEIVARWEPEGPDIVEISGGVHWSVTTPPPSFATPALTDLATESDSVVIAEGNASRDFRDWVAIRAPNGLANGQQLVLEINRRGSALTVATDTSTELLRDDAGTVHQITMPTSCDSGPCGLAMTIEAASDRSAAWRIVEHGSSGEPLRVEHRREQTPRANGYGIALVGAIQPGETLTATAIVAIPAHLLEGADPLRPIKVAVGLRQYQPDGLEWKLRQTEDATPNHVELYCADAPPCEATIGFEVHAPDDSPAIDSARLELDITVYLPHFVLAPPQTAFPIEIAR